MKFLLFFILICIALFFVRKFLSKFKFPKVGSLAVVTGAVKSGKTAFSVGLALSNYRRVHLSWRIKNIFIKFLNCFRKNKIQPIEEPLLYSNIPIVVNNGYCKLTKEHLLRKVRFNFNSVVLVDEASLVADSQLIQDKYINNQLLLFFKLFGHETHGGLCIFNSQSITDLHYSLKRCTSQYFYVHHISKYIPFVCVASVREQVYDEMNNTINVYDKDVEELTKLVLMSKNVFKKYDYCAFSIFTDYLDTINNRIVIKYNESKKVSELVSFRKEFDDLNIVFGGGYHEKENIKI